MKPIPGANRCCLRRLAASSAFALALTLPLAQMSLSMTIGSGSRPADKRPDVVAGPACRGAGPRSLTPSSCGGTGVASIGQLADAEIRWSRPEPAELVVGNVEVAAAPALAGEGEWATDDDCLLKTMQASASNG
jgi:hypothetical protein